MELGARLATVAAKRDVPFVASYCEYGGVISHAALTCTVVSGEVARNSAGVVRISYTLQGNGAAAAVIRDADRKVIVTLFPDRQLAVRDRTEFGVPHSYSGLDLIGPSHLKSGIPCKRVQDSVARLRNLDELWISEELGVVVVDFLATEAGMRIWHLDSLVEGEPPPELFEIPEGFRVEEAED